MEFRQELYRIYLPDAHGGWLAEVTFPLVAEGVVDINHTFVDDSLRGQGIAGQLLALVVACLQERGLRTRTSCTYATGWFERHPEYASLLDSPTTAT